MLPDIPFPFPDKLATVAGVPENPVDSHFNIIEGHSVLDIAV
jgi:hypothetical protein